jgi:hypothetical protein
VPVYTANVPINGNSNSDRADELLYNIGREYRRTILLIDRFIDNPLKDLIDALIPPAKSLPVDDPIFESNIIRSPLLLELNHAIPCHLELLQESLQQAREQNLQRSGPPRICAWLFAEVTLERVRNDIRQRLNVRYPNGDRVYLRFFDPRVMPHLARILADADAAQSNFSDLLGSIYVWCHLGPEGKLVSYKQTASTFTGAEGRLHFNQATANAIDRIGMLNLAARELINIGMNHGQWDSASIDSKFLEADEMGIVLAEDKIAYAWRAVAQGENFSKSPELKNLIENALMQGLPLEVLLSTHFPIQLASQANVRGTGNS